MVILCEVFWPGAESHVSSFQESLHQTHRQTLHTFTLISTAPVWYAGHWTAVGLLRTLFYSRVHPVDDKALSSGKAVQAKMINSPFWNQTKTLMFNHKENMYSLIVTKEQKLNYFTFKTPERPVLTLLKGLTWTRKREVKIKKGNRSGTCKEAGWCQRTLGLCFTLTVISSLRCVTLSLGSREERVVPWKMSLLMVKLFCLMFSAHTLNCNYWFNYPFVIKPRAHFTRTYWLIHRWQGYRLIPT